MYTGVYFCNKNRSYKITTHLHIKYNKPDLIQNKTTSAETEPSEKYVYSYFLVEMIHIWSPY